MKEKQNEPHGSNFAFFQWSTYMNLIVLSHLWVTTGTYTCTPIISKFLSN